MRNSFSKDSVPKVQVYAANDTKSHSDLCKRHHDITGRKERAARKMMAAIRKKYNKKKGGMISIDEFCDFTGLKKESVREFLSN